MSAGLLAPILKNWRPIACRPFLKKLSAKQGHFYSNNLYQVFHFKFRKKEYFLHNRITDLLYNNHAYFYSDKFEFYNSTTRFLHIFTEHILFFEHIITCRILSEYRFGFVGPVNNMWPKNELIDQYQNLFIKLYYYFV